MGRDEDGDVEARVVVFGDGFRPREWFDYTGIIREDVSLYGMESLWIHLGRIHPNMVVLDTAWGESKVPGR